MLPSYSPKGRKRSQQLQLWKRTGLLIGAIILSLFLWVQYTILTTSLGGVPTHVGELQGATKQVSQHNEQAHLRGNEHTQGQEPAKDNAANPVSVGGGGEGAGHVEEMLADEDVADVEDPNQTVTAVPSEQQEARRLAVRKAMKFAWGNYEEHAFGGDEVDPKSGWKLNNVWGDIACSLVDGMDTLWIMDLKDEFQRARDYVANQLDFSHLGRDGNKVSVFETIIREVGGLLSAFDLSGDTIFKQKAKELMDLLTPAYDEQEGVFYTLFNPHTKEKTFASWAGYRAHIADVGTLQLETRYLSDITGDPKYAEMGDAFYQILKREGSYKNTGLFPVHFNSGLGKFDSRGSVITLGALGDSFYEYLLKVYIYSGKREEDEYLRDLYDDAVRGMEEHLLYFSIPDDLYFLQEMKVPSFSCGTTPLNTAADIAVQRMDHLLCFVPGLLALGTLSETEDHAKNTKHLELAEKLMETCYQLYHRQPTGLSPDIVSFPKMR
ncbi:Mannosyl-oligosaccharide alpha-1,2-mannosidase, partial [Phytophthora palmivora]